MKPLPARHILTVVFIASLLPFIAVGAFYSSLYRVMDITRYLVFHNIAEFFSVMVSMSIFGVGWFTYDQSKDRHVLFLSTAFFAIGLMDFMHTLGYAGMPQFITPNSANKSTQYWIAVRLFSAAAFLASAFIYPDKPYRWLSKRSMMTAAVAVPILVFTWITFFPSQIPATFIEGAGLTPFKKISEYLIIGLLTLATAVYWRRMSRTGNRMLLYYLSAFILCIFSELVFAVYKSVFDTFNVLGHLYKVTAFYLIYKGTFASSVNDPYVRLSDANENLRIEIDERKRAEEALQKSSEEIYALNAELEQRVEQRTAQLEAANRELEAFSYSVSHDLRAPLRSIDGFSQTLLEDYREKLDEHGKDYLNRVRAATQRMAQLIDDLLKLSRITRSEKLSEPVNLSDLALSVAEELRNAEPERKVEFVIRQEVMTRGDAQLLRVVLQNLIGNAWKYTGKKARARIEFGVTEKEGKPVYFVRDDGAGFDMTYAGKLFTAFQRLHKESEFAGSGIGLALVQRIIHRHGGLVWAEGEVDKGATVYFTLNSG